MTKLNSKRTTCQTSFNQLNETKDSLLKHEQHKTWSSRIMKSACISTTPTVYAHQQQRDYISPFLKINKQSQNKPQILNLEKNSECGKSVRLCVRLKSSARTTSAKEPNMRYNIFVNKIGKNISGVSWNLCI